MAKGEHRQNTDTDWVALLKERLQAHGAKSQLARDADLHPSTISRIAKGYMMGVATMLRVSREAGIRPPVVEWLDDDQVRLLAAFERLRQFDAPDNVEVVVNCIEVAGEGLEMAAKGIRVANDAKRRLAETLGAPPKPRGEAPDAS